jgi:hypothetical protein
MAGSCRLIVQWKSESMESKKTGAKRSMNGFELNNIFFIWSIMMRFDFDKNLIVLLGHQLHKASAKGNCSTIGNGKISFGNS